MFFLKKIHFKKNVYPKFYHNLELANKDECAIVFMDVISNALTIMVIINFKAVIFKKRIDSPLLIEHITLPHQIDNLTDDFYALVMKTKYNASTVKNNHFIEHFSEMITRVKILYQLSFEQQHNIWIDVFSLEPNFFKSNIPITLPTGTENKWID